MSGLQIACPKCGKTLKLPDRSLLGRKGKCPKCRHAFVLTAPAAEEELSPTEVIDDDPLDVGELYDELEQIERRRQAAEPDEVQMELAEPSLGTPQPGTGARWIPDAAAPNVAAAPAAPQPPVTAPGYPYPMPQMPMPGQPWGMPPGYVAPYPPQPGMPYPPMPPGYAPMYGFQQYGQMPAAPPPQSMPVAPTFAQPVPAPAAPAANDNPFAAFTDAEPAPSAMPSQEEMFSAPSTFATKSKSKSRTKKTRQSQQKQLAAFIAIGLLVVGGIAFATLGGKTGNAKSKSKTVAQNPDEAIDTPEESLPWESPLPVSPTKGPPIDMVLMPYGVSAVVHVRPSELWEKGTKREEFRYCWGPLGEWLEKQIKGLCNHEPSQIEELTFGFVPGVVGEPVQICGVVRLKQAAQKTELIKLFREMKAELKETDSGDYPVYESDKYAYVIKDLQTFAFCPRLRQTEMAEAVNRPNAQSPGLEALLKKTDRLRHIVVMFDPTTLGAHAQFILPTELHRLAERVVEFFDPKQVETVAWSLHVSDKFHSEILARNKSSTAKTAVQFELKKKLDQVPRELADSIRGYMDPKQLGPREIIGRFPAMTKVYALSTHASTGDRYASLATSLPERAAPNLAIGALLTWDESTRTDFSKSAAPTSKPQDTGKLPELVADRLKVKLEVEFNRTPLQDAFKYIADELKTTIEIDGDALKDAGFTKNMPQTMTLGKVTGLEGIAAILKRYEKEAKPMVLVIEEPKKRALITTKPFAEKSNLTPFALP